MPDHVSPHPKPLYVVGAGPGDPELITVKGQRLLATADVVLTTGSLVPEELLSWCRADAEIVDTRSHTLETWIPLALERVQSGLQVVRLQDGDPCLYGALYELLTRMLAAGIRVEIVPGVSAFQLAAARLGVELTVPELVQTIILTRTSGRTQVPEAEELSLLASHRASLCLYLSARHVEQAQAQLLTHYPPETPMAICYRLGWPDEWIQLGSLAEMATLSRDQDLERTVLYLISPALKGVEASDPTRSRLYNPDHAHLFRARQKSQG
jgi:precorrin-4/cobalt-precorrin-4 C11-methyltransferase